MLRIRTQKEIKGVLLSLLQIHHEGFSESKEQVLQNLSDCQQAAVAVGEQLERELTDSAEIVHILENYCEVIFQISQDLQSLADHVPQLDQMIQMVADRVSVLPAKYQILFMPYKAAMWDSLESIWMAAVKDPDCDCKVIPLPYFELDPEKKEMQERYEGDRFPSYVPIVHYEDYSLPQELPDVIYIHNPYDDCNHVTSIHPSYYSEELKKYTQKLIYVPYFVTSGFYSQDQRVLPAYYHMDHIVVQSEHYMHEVEGIFYYDKILPLGSPKLDRVIRVCKEGGNIPRDWRTLIQDKKVIMLNTSIGQTLSDTGAYLSKLQYLFDYFKNRADVVLIWRPHPLLKATLQSMRPEYAGQYEALLSAFQKQKVGILDQTPDLASTIAVSDAYIGEISSSVVNLFGAAGKPQFMLNNYVYEDYMEAEKRRIVIGDICEENGHTWVSTSIGLFEKDRDWEHLRFAGRVGEQAHWDSAYPYAAAAGGKLYLSPLMATKPVVYDTETGRFAYLSGLAGETDLKCRQVFVYKEHIFYLPDDAKAIYEYDIIQKSWTKHTDCMTEWKKGAQFPYYEDTFAYRIRGNELFVTASYSNRILKFNLENGQYEFLKVGEDGAGFSGIELIGEELWLAEVHSGRIVRCSFSTKSYAIIEMPQEFQTWQAVYGRYLAHTEILQMGDYVVTIPGFSNGMVKIDRRSGEAVMLLSELWKVPENRINGFNSKVFLNAGFSRKLDENTLYVQRNCDAALLKINVTQGTCEAYHPRMSKESLAHLMQGEDGFEKADTTADFSRKESPFFSLGGFVDDLVGDRLEQVKIRQKEALRTMAANLDGTCGEKVHAYIRKELDAEYRKA